MDKTYASIEEQISFIERKNCTIVDNEKLAAFLESVSYYRFRGYFIPFYFFDRKRQLFNHCFPYRQKEKERINIITSEQLINVYEFDKRLRSEIIRCIDSIEIFLRSRISDVHSNAYGPLGYEEYSYFLVGTEDLYRKLLRRINTHKQENKKLLFIKHYNENHSGKIPLWVACEIFSLGTLSFFFKLMKTEDKIEVASYMPFFKDLDKNSGKAIGIMLDISGWIHCCSDLRNACAHQDRLYYQKYDNSEFGRTLQHINLKSSHHRLWDMIMAMRMIYPNAKEWNNSFCTSITALLTNYESYIDIKHIGFPNDWMKQIYITPDSIRLYRETAFC